MSVCRGSNRYRTVDAAVFIKQRQHVENSSAPQHQASSDFVSAGAADSYRAGWATKKTLHGMAPEA